MHVHFCQEELQAIVALFQNLQIGPGAWLRLCLDSIGAQAGRVADILRSA